MVIQMRKRIRSIWHMIVKCVVISVIIISPFNISNAETNVGEYYDEVVATFYEHFDDGRLVLGADFTGDLYQFFIDVREEYCDYDEEDEWWYCDTNFSMFNCSSIGEYWVVDQADCEKFVEEDLQEVVDDANEDISEAVDDMPNGVDVVITTEKSGSLGISFISLLFGILLIKRKIG